MIFSLYVCRYSNNKRRGNE